MQGKNLNPELGLVRQNIKGQDSEKHHKKAMHTEGGISNNLNLGLV